MPEVNSLLTSRYADQSDLATVLELYMAALAEIRDYIETPDLERCADTVFSAWIYAPCVLLESAGKIIGFAGLKTYRPTHSLQTVLTEYMFYIMPEHRSVKAARMLSKAVQAVADKFKLPLRMTHMVFDTPIAVKEKFLRRWGYDIAALSVIYKGGEK